jgi:hypothetical protein
LPRHGASSGCGWRPAVNILNKQLREVDKEWTSILGVGNGDKSHEILLTKYDTGLHIYPSI